MNNKELLTIVTDLETAADHIKSLKTEVRQLWETLALIYGAAKRLLSPEQCSLLTDVEEKAFGLAEIVSPSAG